MLILILGVEHVGGDMFECVPHGDAIFMKVNLFVSCFSSSLIYALVIRPFNICLFHSHKALIPQLVDFV